MEKIQIEIQRLVKMAEELKDLQANALKDYNGRTIVNFEQPIKDILYQRFLLQRFFGRK